jgi:uncharacterized protein
VHDVRVRGTPEGTVVDEEITAEPIDDKVRSRMERALRFRQQRLVQDLARHRVATRPLRVAITGASGFLGTHLRTFLESGGHQVLALSRQNPAPAGSVTWDPEADRIDAAALEGIDAVVHLAGESIAAGRWNDERRQRILDSRVRGTGLLAHALAGLARPPSVLISASAIGYYGDRGAEPLDESAAAGTGFLPDVARAWEAAADPARERGIRVVHPRIGIVLAADGGALHAMLPPFRAGVGGRIGHGRQVMSWVALDDVLWAVHHAIWSSSLNGPMNVTAPAPVSNAAFARTLGKVLHRPALLPLPGPVVTTLFGEMGRRLLLEGACVVPRRLQESGYTFGFPSLQPALHHLLDG